MANAYRVNGMSCQGCAASVTRAIQGAAPGATVGVDLDAATVSVDGADENTVKTAVNDAGYEFVGAADS